MNTVVEEAFTPRVVVDNTKEGEGRPMEKELLKRDFSSVDFSGSVTIESEELYNSVVRSEGWDGL